MGGVTVTIRVADVEPVTVALTKASDLVDAAADLLTVLSDQKTWSHEAAIVRDAVGEFRTTVSRINGN